MDDQGDGAKGPAELPSLRPGLQSTMGQLHSKICTTVI